MLPAPFGEPSNAEFTVDFAHRIPWRPSLFAVKRFDNTGNAGARRKNILFSFVRHHATPRYLQHTAPELSKVGAGIKMAA